MSKEIFTVLSLCPLFHQLDAKQIFYIARFFKQQLYRKGTLVLQEGQKVEELYIISQGTWDVFLPKDVEIPREHDVHLGTLSRCALLGEYAFIDQCLASASVRAIEDAALLCISRENFEKVISDDRVGKVIYKNLLLALISRLRKQNDEKDLMNLLDF
ncbi:cyclic nucleotide-binding protein [Beggiatoa alba B18LD]|uniref:Cyclic nucleotide-binding protein n=1 Tax=Beggiatoa alba B18LD TaxID=395493 RepID=I3CC05_9GAMM|nr:cyclic nucleotide-binding domain-containing protein [Beggiatoa alba]EIJ41148.1 cyclic nucleotide-binding protein [Beggiatoa alba B18LD]